MQVRIKNDNDDKLFTGTSDISQSKSINTAASLLGYIKPYHTLKLLRTKSLVSFTLCDTRKKSDAETAPINTTVSINSDSKMERRIEQDIASTDPTEEN